MKVLRAATIWVWWCVMMYIVVMTSSVAIEIEQQKQVKQPTRYSTVTLIFGSPNTGFGGNYNDLERAAGTSRRTIALTFESLDNDVRAVSGSSVPSRQVEATFFLRAIQMVAEGARFRLIQRAIHSGGAADPSFRDKLINYENSWDIISQRIHQASPQCQTPLAVGSGIIFQNATQITKDMGLLKYRNVRYLSQIKTTTIATPLVAHE